MLSPLSNLRNSRWRPRWPPLHINDHNSLPVHHRKVIFVSIPRFQGSSYQLKLSIMLISYYIMAISKMAAKMAAVTQKLAYLLNYLIQISREGVYHWLFWRHIYLYQIKVHILMMSSRNPRWLPVYKHWYIFYTILSWEKYEKVNDYRCYIITSVL